MKCIVDFMPLETTVNSHFLDFGIVILSCLLINVSMYRQCEHNF